MNRSQKKLKQFYQELAIWINAGMPGHKVFVKDAALCYQLSRWCGKFPWYVRIFSCSSYIQHLQTELLWDRYGTPGFPFGEGKYMKEVRLGNHYTNEDRLKFIFEQSGMKQENK